MEPMTLRLSLGFGSVLDQATACAGSFEGQAEATDCNACIRCWPMGNSAALAAAVATSLSAHALKMLFICPYCQARLPMLLCCRSSADCGSMTARLWRMLLMAVVR